MLIIIICYFFISLFYYNYLKNYTEEVESEALPRFNWRDLGGIQFNTGSNQLELENDNSCQRNEQGRKATIASDNIIDNPATSTGRQSGFKNIYTIEKLIRSTLTKLYIILAVYLIQWAPFYLIQTASKPLKIHLSPDLDGIGCFLVHLIPLTNPCFVLFFHFETYQELRFLIYLNYYRYFN
jgi:hypothetical protein